MKRAGFGVLYFTWLYGVPFLLIVGVLRRASTPYTPTRASALAFAATTDRLLQAGLILNLVLPLAGYVLATLADEVRWRRLFQWAIGGMVVLYLAVGAVAGAASGPLVGHVPADEEPRPTVTRCVPRSGGHGCPGG